MTKKDDIKLRYNSMEELQTDLDHLVALGFAELTTDPETGKEGYRITPEGIKMFQYQAQLAGGKLN